MKTKFNGILTLILALLVQVAFAQEKTISGTVSDDSGPLPGVTVIVKGTTVGTQTDFDGNYTLRVNVGDVLVFSYVGMETVERTVGASNTIDVTMTGSTVLEEIVILGYGTQRKTEVTGSTVQVNSEEIELIPVSTIDQVLQGKVAGLVFNSESGTPGSTTDIRIRGVSSITAGNEPLYVIDGVPVHNNNVSATGSGSSLSALASINSNNIESITVLKDASATAAYGARGANGVIVITTKSGKDGKTTFNFSSSYGFANDATDGPTPLTGAEREMLYYEALFNTYGESYNLANVAEAEAWYNTSGFFASDYLDWNNAGRPEANWEKVITNEDAPIQEYNLSATGGDETSSFYASVGYFAQEATVIGSEFDRVSGTFNYTKDLTDKITFSTRNSASHSYQDGLLESSAYFSSPRSVKFFNPGIEQPYLDDGSINIFGTSLPNPLWIAQEDIDDSKFTRIITNNSLVWETPIENLTFTTRSNIDYQVYNYKRYRNKVRGDGAGSDGYGWQAHRNNVTYVFQNQLNYTYNINDDHSVDFTAVQEYQKNRSYYLDADGDSFATEGLTNLASAGNPTWAFSEFFDYALARYVGMLHYSGYNGKYVFDGTFTREGNSRFSKNNRWGNFWSVGAAWNLHKEDFLDVEFINNMKLRASYGVTGNANIGLNQYQAKFGYGGSYAGEGAVNPTTFGNEDLSWETSHTLDIGMDFGLFQNKVSGSFVYYNRESKDLLLNVPLPPTTGFNSQTRNIGRMENKGIELEMNFNIVQTEDFNLSLGGNMATTENEVLELAKGVDGEQQIITTSSTRRIEEGHPVNAWNMRTWAGVDPANGDELYYLDGVGGATTNNFNDAERVWQGGSAIPKITAGLNFHVDYKGFFVDANGYYAGGHKVYEGWHRYTQGTDYFSVWYYQGLNTLLDRWQPPGDETRFGKMIAGTIPWQRHSKFLYDGDFARLKNLTVGYDFNQDLLDTVGFDGVRVFVRGTNLFTWVKEDLLTYDPEVDANGLIGLRTPPVKSIIFGINLKF